MRSIAYTENRSRKRESNKEKKGIMKKGKKRAFCLALSGLLGSSLQPPVSALAADSYTVYRLYNPNSGEHFFTQVSRERNQLIAAGWRNEGTAWQSPAAGWYVYRLYNPNTGDHHYCMDTNERDALVRFGWRYEDVAFASTDLAWTAVKEASGKPVYRLYNPNAWTATHHFTRDVNEANALLRLGWRYEGVAWFCEG